MIHARLAALTALVLFLGLPASAASQVVDTTGTPVDSVIVTPEADVAVAPAADTMDGGVVSPGGAFLRSLIIPGWGQAEFDAYFRGGIYFAGWAANWFMNFRNYTRLEDARSRFGLRESQIADSLAAAGIPADSIPLLLPAAVEADAAGDDLGQLVRAREQQREDWIAWSIFWLLASGVDAFVTAHLADFPAAIDLEPGAENGISVRVDVPLPRRRP